MYAQIPYPVLLDMSGVEKARVVAHYRAHGLVESWQNWAARQSATNAPLPSSGRG